MAAPTTLEAHAEPGEQVTLRVFTYALTKEPGTKHKPGQMTGITDIALTASRPSRFVVVVAPDDEEPP